MWTLQNFKFADILMSNDPSHHFTALCVSHKIGTMHLYVFKFAGLLENMLNVFGTKLELCIYMYSNLQGCLRTCLVECQPPKNLH